MPLTFTGKVPLVDPAESLRR